MLAKAEPNGNPISTLSTCLQYLLLKVKNDYLMAMFSKSRKSYLGILGGFSLPLYNLSIEISMVSSSRVFVN